MNDLVVGGLYKFSTPMDYYFESSTKLPGQAPLFSIMPANSVFLVVGIRNDLINSPDTYLKISFLYEQKLCYIVVERGVLEKRPNLMVRLQ